MNVITLRQAAVFLGLFAVFGAIEIVGTRRDCSLASALGATLVVYAGMMGLIAFGLWLSERGKRGAKLGQQGLVAVLAVAALWLYAVAQTAGAAASRFGCAL
jgi:hypothetical protein